MSGAFLCLVFCSDCGFEGVGWTAVEEEAVGMEEEEVGGLEDAVVR